MELIMMDGNLICGEVMIYEIVDGVLYFNVWYDFYVLCERFLGDKM